MIILNLTHVYKNRPLLLVLSTNFAVSETDEERVGCVVDDGVHNNGGWRVKETREEIIEMMNAQKQKLTRKEIFGDV